VAAVGRIVDGAVVAQVAVVEVVLKIDGSVGHAEMSEADNNRHGAREDRNYGAAHRARIRYRHGISSSLRERYCTVRFEGAAGGVVSTGGGT
jgi:hypothetical protein